MAIRMFSITKTFLVVSISAAPLLLVFYYKNKFKPKETNTKYYFKCTFITVKNSECRQHLVKNYICSKDCSVVYLNELLCFLKTAKKTISLCMYILTLSSVYETLVEAHKLSINVRIIADSEMARQSSSKIAALKNEGIPVKMQPLDDSLMHHKFCLIDENDNESGKLFFGSLNLTLQGFSSNWDQIIYTDKTTIVERFREEFECMWQEVQ